MRNLQQQRSARSISSKQHSLGATSSQGGKKRRPASQHHRQQRPIPGATSCTISKPHAGLPAQSIQTTAFIVVLSLFFLLQHTDTDQNSRSFCRFDSIRSWANLQAFSAPACLSSLPLARRRARTPRSRRPSSSTTSLIPTGAPRSLRHLARSISRPRQRRTIAKSGPAQASLLCTSPRLPAVHDTLRASLPKRLARRESRAAETVLASPRHHPRSQAVPNFRAILLFLPYSPLC